MICSKCGSQNNDNTNFCTHCGNTLTVGNNQNHQDNTQDFNNANISNDYNQKKMSKGKIAAIICAIVAILLIICATGLFIFKLVNKDTNVKFAISITDYDETKSTSFPVIVESSEATEIKYIDINGDGLALKDGDYKLSFPAGPLCDNGNFYNAPNDKCNVSIKKGKADVTLSGSSETLKYEKEDPLYIADSDIDNALQYAKSCPQNGDEAEIYANNTRTTRDNAIAELDRQSQEQAKAQAQAAAKAKTDKKARASTQLTSGKYVLSSDPTYYMQLNMEGKNLTITQNGQTVMYAVLMESEAAYTAISKETISFYATGKEYGKEICGAVPKGGTHPLTASFVVMLKECNIVLENRHMDSNNPFCMANAKGSWSLVE